MKTRKMIILLIAALFILGSVSAYAQRGGGFGHGKADRGAGGPGPCIEDGLELTPDQIKQVQDSRVEMKKQLIPLEADLKLARLELHEMIRSGADQATIDKKIDAMATIKTSIQKIRVGHRVQFRNMLTDEQKAKFDSRPMHGGDRGGRHGGRGQGHGMCNNDCRFSGGGGRGPGDCRWLDTDGN